MLKKKMKQQLL